MSLLRNSKLLSTGWNLITKYNQKCLSVAQQLPETMKKDDEVLPLDFFRENCILVDSNDKAIGAASKKDCHKVEGDSIRLHRAFSVFLFNKSGEMLLQKRSAAKVKSSLKNAHYCAVTWSYGFLSLVCYISYP